MDHNVIQYHGRGKDQAVVEGEGAPGGAAAPAGFLIPNGDGCIAAAGELMIVVAALLELCSGCAAISFFQGFQALCLCLAKVDVLRHGNSFLRVSTAA